MQNTILLMKLAFLEKLRTHLKRIRLSLDKDYSFGRLAQL
jgi:hypothetical protein